MKALLSRSLHVGWLEGKIYNGKDDFFFFLRETEKYVSADGTVREMKKRLDNYRF